MQRRISRQIKLGGLSVGGGAPITVQSMTNTKTHDAAATIAQINALADAGCDIVRVAVPDERAAGTLSYIKQSIALPLVADIHFDYRLALLVLDAGVDGLRINPGNIGAEANVRRVADKAKTRGVPIRIGVNAGSLPAEVLREYGRPCPEALLEAALKNAALLEKQGFTDIKLSLKAHDALLTINAYKLAAAATDYPLHIGVTEAGTPRSGLVKSAVGIGALLAMGIGDTLRVSLTGDPLEEVKAGREILKALGLRPYGPTVIACPTCGRTEIDLEKLALRVEDKLSGVKDTITVAVMGCVVNGPGEAKEADVGIAGGKGVGLLFKKGRVLRKVPEAALFDELLREIDDILCERAKEQ
ncbi:MAG: flavodoxin-dependent (E)-4-hydroxy-3-methylbut-2-enyl-diphosphate synthase [Acidaminococcales bacterium]|jgi:(E)-4-hydroxy-3-methylbut-2-enyl-diphosphate synthase|nr:flavodoxin-dependent (E)-4-hydroxy-3-methylbut-2-enyl-diphosphate synthase [Acidaminococcales bacterium]